MLKSLTIENAALITLVDIELKNGLNILTGETGAGKSMIADALNFILGQKPPRDFIRQGCERAFVSCVIECTDENIPAVKQIFEHIDEDNLLIIERALTPDGKAPCRINGKTVSIGAVKEIAAYLFDIHSQREHQKLLNPARHTQILDKFTHISGELNELTAIIKQLRDIDAKISALSGNEGDRESLVDLYRFQIGEIESAGITPGEEERLAERRRVINNAEEIADKAKTAVRAIADGGASASALDLLITGQKALNKLAALDNACAGYAAALDDIIIRLDDLGRDLRAYKNTLTTDPYELKEIEERLDTLYNLKRKYGRTAEDILDFYEKVKAKLDSLENAEEKIAELNKKRGALREQAGIYCETITKARKTAADAISGEIINNLRDLEMKDAVFAVNIERLNDYTTDGIDKTEFMLSANAGEPLKPLAQVASGGEVSRVMLALKACLSKADPAETYVFDEIDTGVSGRAAQKVAQKLKELSVNKQILCITHLPQIAAYADNHILVEKTAEDNTTVTNAVNLDEEGTQQELARLIGGAVITEQTKKAAAQLRQMALEQGY